MKNCILRTAHLAQNGQSWLYQLGEEMVCNGHCAGAVALNVLQMLLKCPAHRLLLNVLSDRPSCSDA